MIKSTDLTSAMVDVRDVADLHFRAMTDPKAKGERFIAVVGDPLTMHDTAQILKKRLGEKAKNVPTMRLPTILLRLVAVFDRTVGMIIPELGQMKYVSNEKATSVLGWKPRSAEDAIVASAESLERFGLLKK